jgi:membrane fusion protein, multidrug efflux system
VPIYLNALGNVLPTYSVTVKTQVNGTLLRVYYREGQMVKTGELIAEIDPRPFEAQLTQAIGQLERDEAQLANAKIDLKRYQKLWIENSVSEQILATQAALVKQLQGTVKLDQGLIQAAEVNLIYCKITSPIDGRIGLRLVDPGNFVQTSDTTGIAIINTLNPITITFTIPQDNIPEVMQKLANNQTLLVEAFDRELKNLLATGILLTVDNQIDPTTGTVKLKAQFKNDKNLLFPSQFVNIRLLVNILHRALVVPSAAVQLSTKGNLVYVLDRKTLTVKEQRVETGVMFNGFTVINSGLTVGQTVVDKGTDQLTNGTKVTLAEEPAVEVND